MADSFSEILLRANGLAKGLDQPGQGRVGALPDRRDHAVTPTHGLPSIPQPAGRMAEILNKRLRRGDVSQEGARTQAQIFHAIHGKGHDIAAFGEGIKDIHLARAVREAATHAQVTDVESYISDGRARALAVAIDNAQREASKSFFEAHLRSLESDWNEESNEIRLSLGNGRMLDPPQIPAFAGAQPAGSMATNPSLLTAEMKMLATEVRQMARRPEEVVQHFRQIIHRRPIAERVENTWTALELILRNSPPQPEPTPVRSDMIDAAIDCLQQRFIMSIESQLERHDVQISKLSMQELIERYVALVWRSFQGRGDERSAKAFFAWRCGRVDIAAKFDDTFDALYREYKSGAARGAERRLRSTDLFEQAIANVLSRASQWECPAILLSNFEDWLWIKLCKLPLDPSSRERDFETLQHCVSVEYGARHFQADQYPMRYVLMLTLTMQLEKAVEFLWEVGDLVAAVHYAIACSAAHRLNTTKTARGNKLVEAGGAVQVNMAQLLTIYTRAFVKSDPTDALAYLAIIKDTKVDASSNLTCLERGVCDIVLETGEWELVFGSFERDGSRRPGVAAALISAKELEQLVARVAEESERRGRFVDALRLLDLCDERQRALSLLVRRLSQEASAAGAQASLTRPFADYVLTAGRDRYQSLAEFPRVSQLVDMVVCFEAYAAKRYEDLAAPLENLYRELLPCTPLKARDCAATIQRLDPEIKANIPMLLLCAMASLQYILAHTDSARDASGMQVHLLTAMRQESLDKAEALVRLPAELPYHLPATVGEELIRMHAAIAL